RARGVIILTPHRARLRLSRTHEHGHSRLFSSRLTFVRTNAAFLGSVHRPMARWVPLLLERELRPLALLAWAPQLQAFFAAVSPLALCVSPSFLSSVFPRRSALRPPI